MSFNLFIRINNAVNLMVIIYEQIIIINEQIVNKIF